MVEKQTKSKTAISWIDTINLDELIETTNLNIIPKFDLIAKGDLITTVKAKILSIPKEKELTKKDGEKLTIPIMEVEVQGIKYQLFCSSIALQRSIISLAIKECNADTRDKIDLSKIIGKTYNLKRDEFTAKGFTQAPLKFFMPDM